MLREGQGNILEVKLPGGTTWLWRLRWKSSGGNLVVRGVADSLRSRSRLSVDVNGEEGNFALL